MESIIDQLAYIGQIILGAILLIPLIYIYVWAEYPSLLNDLKLKRTLMNDTPIDSAYFLDNWITHKEGNKAVSGYKTLDQPGCYVIATNPSEDWSECENVYVGQSLHVCSRVRSHLTGQGNGNVYADVREGKRVCIRIITCPKEEMNTAEKRLISLFNATSSYNSTSGGSRRR